VYPNNVELRNLCTSTMLNWDAYLYSGTDERVW